MSPVTVYLIHWNASEVEVRARQLVSAGFSVQFDLPPIPELIRRLGQAAPDVVLIDLSRLPSQGRDLGVALRQTKATRAIPILFVGGEQLKVARIQALLPDATFTTWEAIESAVQQALTKQPVSPVIPQSRFAAYAGAALPKKLGIRAGFKVGLIGAPSEFASRLDDLPEGVTFEAGLKNACDLAIWFVRDRDELERDLLLVTRSAGDIPLWIAWEKRTIRPAGEAGTGVTQTLVRKTGLAAGWVDYKICSIDEHWSGLLFRRRKPG